MGGGGEHSGFVLIMFIKSPHQALWVSLRESAYRKQGTWWGPGTYFLFLRKSRKQSSQNFTTGSVWRNCALTGTWWRRRPPRKLNHGLSYCKCILTVLLLKLSRGVYWNRGNFCSRGAYWNEGAYINRKWGKRIRGSAFLFSYYFFHKFGELSSIHLLHQ